MADLLKMDPARIARLRDPARYDVVDPIKLLDVVNPVGDGPVVDVGAGVGFVTLPFARALPQRPIVAVDVLPEMLALLSEDAADLANVETATMPGPATIPLDDGMASLVVMLQVHHELDDAPSLMAECRRILAPGAAICIVDWKPDPEAKGRRVSQERIADDLKAAGLAEVVGHDLYEAHSVTVGRMI